MQKYKAVIIDDEKWTRKVIRSLGEWDRLGIEIAGEASDGEYGLELIRQVKPDIVLTDVCMPRLNGLELAERMKAENSGIQLIFISGYDDYSYVRNAMKLGAADYLLKPVKPEELNRQLHDCVERLGQTEENRRLEEQPADFLREEWAEDYYRYRDSLAGALDAGSPDSLERRLGEMKEFLKEKLSGGTHKGSMICIYYMLINALQTFILGRGYRTEEIFEGKRTTFVFSEECTPEEMMDFIGGLYTAAAGEIQARLKGRNRLDIGKIEVYLKEHYREGVTLEQTAAEFFVSKEYLSKAFKASVGKGFSEYLTGLRMEKARELLLEDKAQIRNVAEMVGYVDQAHFYRTFKKYFGMTPGEMKPV